MFQSQDNRLLRYSRHILLPQIGESGQSKLEASTVLIIGLGGLGSPAAMYLASSGVGRLILADHDKVDLSNLQRQILHTTGRVGGAKTGSAVACLQELNPEVELTACDIRADAQNLPPLVEQADVVVDASDNFDARDAINAVCWEHATPLVSGAAIRMEAQISVFNPSDPDSPCYRCLYPPGAAVDEACVSNGILAPLAGAVGAMQAIEALKLLVGFGEPVCGRVLLFDAALMQWREVKLGKNPGCPVCG